MLTFPAPKPLNGQLLTDQFASVGMTTAVHLDEDKVVLRDLQENDRAAARTVIEAHAAAAQASLDQAATEGANETTIQDRATAALADNKAFLVLASPTNAQVAAQVKALTRQNNALIRLVLKRFDGAD